MFQNPFLLSYSFWPVHVKHFVFFLGRLRHFISVAWLSGYYTKAPGAAWEMQWLELVPYVLFVLVLSGTWMFHFASSLQVHPNPGRPTYLRLKVYEFAGRLVGKCLYESSLGGAYKQLVRARFTRSFLAQIIGLRMHYKVKLPSLVWSLCWSGGRLNVGVREADLESWLTIYVGFFSSLRVPAFFFFHTVFWNGWPRIL